jgi:hypothetical protein
VLDHERTSPSGLAVPLNFEMTAPAFPDDSSLASILGPLQNPQSKHLLAMLGVDISDRLLSPAISSAQSNSSASMGIANPEEIDLDDVEDEESSNSARLALLPQSSNPEEIDLDDI